MCECATASYSRCRESRAVAEVLLSLPAVSFVVDDDEVPQCSAPVRGHRVGSRGETDCPVYRDHFGVRDLRADLRQVSVSIEDALLLAGSVHTPVEVLGDVLYLSLMHYGPEWDEPRRAAVGNVNCPPALLVYFLWAELGDGAVEEAALGHPSLPAGQVRDWCEWQGGAGFSELTAPTIDDDEARQLWEEFSRNLGEELWGRVVRKRAQSSPGHLV